MIISILILLIIIGVAFYYLKTDKLIILKGNDFSHKWNQSLKLFEHEMSHWYPLGNDEFQINHGKTYMSFFQRMGFPHMVTLYKHNKIYATGCGILRKLNGNKTTCWYICDLKVHPFYRKQWIPFKMLCKAIHLAKYTSRCYAVSMNNEHEDNHIVKLSQKVSYGPIKFKTAGKLLLYSLDYHQMLLAMPLIIQYKGPIDFISLSGIKDIVLKSTQKPMKLLHLNLVKHNYRINSRSQPLENYTHMFCFHERDPLVQALNQVQIQSDSNASIIHCGMEDLIPEDWDFIQTSEI